MSDASLAHSEPHAEEEENYFISMTDMMVGVLFVFIILLMVFAANFRQQTETSEDQIKQLKQAAELARRVADDVSDLRKRVTSEITVLNESDQVRRHLLDDIRDEFRRKTGLIVDVDYESGVVRLGENAIKFGDGDSKLDALAQERVRLLADVLASILPRYASNSNPTSRLETLFIEGHTDPRGGDKLNWPLSTQRAVSTFVGLTGRQPSLRTLRNVQGTEVLSVAGYAFTRMIDGATNESQRRIDLRFVMSTDSMERLKDVLRLTDSMQDQLDSLRVQLDKVSGD